MDKLARIETVKKEVPVAAERRRDPRIEAEMPVRLRLRQVDVGYHGVSANLSMGGVYVLTACLPPVGTSVDVELRPAGSVVPLPLRATVVRHGAESEPAGMGLAFDWISEEAGSFIYRLLG